MKVDCEYGIPTFSDKGHFSHYACPKVIYDQCD